MPLTFPAQLGGDVSGTVEAVGPGVTSLAVGDRVMGMINPFADGAYADKIVVPATLLARVPAKLDLAEAAALPMGALTGSQLIEVGLKPTKGDVVLVTGAAGSVGRAAVYAAAKAGAKVVAGVRKGSEAVVKDLPVAAVIDLADLAAAKATGPFDGIADTVGGLVVERLARFLKRGGTIASAVSPTPVPDAAHGVTVKPVWVAFDGPRLTAFAEEVAAGRYTVPIARKLPLIEAAEAHRVAERGASRGKVLLVPKA
jgi:NADPH:quinone reductase-like Zn-dependent oxidoreductase